MFVEAVVFLAAIIGVLLSLSAFIFHMITRKPEDETDEKDEQALALTLDAVTDAALEEINKTAQLVLDELNEKYNALLFVYQLIDDKHKALEASDGATTGPSMGLELGLGLGLDVSVDDGLELAPTKIIEENIAGADLRQEIKPEPEPSIEKRAIFAHHKYSVIKEMQDEGLPISEIARRLNMGQGEIQLIIGLSGR